MHLRAAVTVFLAVVATGCEPQTTSSSAAPARFEIRDFKLSEQVNSIGGLEVTGRGTLVALDDSLRKGTYLVWLTAKRTSRKEDEVAAVLVLRDGLSTVETSDYVSKEDRDKFKVRYSDWRMTGYIRFQEAAMVSNSTANSTQK